MLNLIRTVWSMVTQICWLSLSPDPHDCKVHHGNKVSFILIFCGEIHFHGTKGKTLRCCDLTAHSNIQEYLYGVYSGNKFVYSSKVLVVLPQSWSRLQVCQPLIYVGMWQMYCSATIWSECSKTAGILRYPREFESCHCEVVCETMCGYQSMQ